MANCNDINSNLTNTSVNELKSEKALAHLAKALAHPARIRILKILFKLDQLGGCLNSNLVSELGLAQSTVSEHLRVLIKAGFIDATPQATKVCYQISTKQLNYFSNLFATTYQ
ncbi:ArsR/SmtB family transcription factor [Psychromonas hadalis]|uniref:ArsR/SmtB family transcription factor n=1 Tax=Psychromonas hadalis TaxID=211669 RepID=UPI00040893B8|nr:winged helix-turn-helix domain-containing protein [Psychromonas hadalis]